MTDKRIRIESEAEAVNPRSLGVIGPQGAAGSFASIFPPPGESYDGPTDTVITDRELDAATFAYVEGRYKGADLWRKAYPQAWDELRERMRAALIAAAAVRA